MNRDSPFDRWTNAAIALGRSIPVFWLGVLLMGVFTLHLAWLPTGRGASSASMILPAVTLVWLPTAVLAMLTRSALLSSLDSDYVKLASIKGLAEWKIIWKHCLRNVVISPLISFGFVGGSFMTALVLTEAVFSWPGVGHLILQTIGPGGFHPILGGVVVLLTGGFILCHLLFDAPRAFLDPRIRHRESTSLRGGDRAGQWSGPANPRIPFEVLGVGR